MRSLKTVFKADGVVTAANASQISDGTAALVLASPAAVGRYNLNPLARIVARVVVGTDPVLMLDGPIPATRMVLEKAGLSLDNIDVIEMNEAFASVVLGWAKEIQPDMDKVNPNGGAIAHGHPVGATGAILMTKLVYELQRRKAKYGLQTMCAGHGHGYGDDYRESVKNVLNKSLGQKRLANRFVHACGITCSWWALLIDSDHLDVAVFKQLYFITADLFSTARNARNGDFCYDHLRPFELI